MPRSKKGARETKMKPMSKKAVSLRLMLINTVRKTGAYCFAKEYFKDIRYLVDEYEKEVAEKER